MVGGVSSRSRAGVLPLSARRQLKSGAPRRRGGQSGICGTRTGQGEGKSGEDFDVKDPRRRCSPQVDL